MKTAAFITNFLVASVLTIGTISCGKKELAEMNPVISEGQQFGSILDLGVVSGNPHLMEVNLSNASIIMNSLKVASIAASMVNINLFTSSNGIINDGIYSYSSSDYNVPFTFNSGSIYLQNAVSNNFETFNMNGGNITIYKEGTVYHITLAGTLTNGNTILGTFNGVLTYSDLMNEN